MYSLLASDCITKTFSMVSLMYQMNWMKKKYQVKSIVFLFLNFELLDQFTLKEIIMNKRILCKRENNFVKLKEWLQKYVYNINSNHP